MVEFPTRFFFLHVTLFYFTYKLEYFLFRTLEQFSYSFNTKIFVLFCFFFLSIYNKNTGTRIFCTFTCYSLPRILISRTLYYSFFFQFHNSIKNSEPISVNPNLIKKKKRYFKFYTFSTAFFKTIVNSNLNLKYTFLHCQNLNIKRFSKWVFFNFFFFF